MNPTDIRSKAIEAHEALLQSIAELEELGELAFRLPEFRDCATPVPQGQTIWEACDDDPGRCYVYRIPHGKHGKDAYGYAMWLKRTNPRYEFAVSFDGAIVVRAPGDVRADETPRFPILPAAEPERRAPLSFIPAELIRE